MTKKTAPFILAAFLLIGAVLAPALSTAQNSAVRARPNLALGTLRTMDAGGLIARNRGFDNGAALRSGAVVVPDGQGGVQEGSKEDIISKIIKEDTDERTALRDVPPPGTATGIIPIKSTAAKIGITAAAVAAGALLGALLGGPLGAVLGGILLGAVAAWLVGLF